MVVRLPHRIEIKNSFQLKTEQNKYNCESFDTNNGGISLTEVDLIPA